MENYHYNCQNCGKSYVPKRRRVQKYCSNSCRTRAFYLKKEKALLKPETGINKSDSNKIDKMSLAGIGNAAAGTIAVNALASLLTREENKPATKKDIKEIKELLLERYHEVLNMQLDAYGNKPFFDIETNTIVYLKK